MLRSENDSVLLLDSGGNFDPNPKAGEARFKAQVTTKAMNIMGYDAMNLGTHELAQGIDFLRETAESSRFAFIASNLDFGKQRPSWVREYLIKTVGGIRVLILGVMPETADVDADAVSLKETQPYKVIQPAETVERLLKRLQGKADLTVLLSQLSLESTCTLVDSIRGIDIAVFSGTGSKSIAESRIDPRTLVFATGSKGLHLGLIRISLTSDDKMTIETSPPVVLDGSIPTDERINDLIRDKENWFEKERHEKLKKNLELSPYEFFEKLKKGTVQ